MGHILFISRYYSPEKAAAAVCVSETAKRLVKIGHKVTVLTTMPNYPTGIVPIEYRRHLLQKETIDGVHIVRVWSYISANKGFFRRILAQLSFGCLAPIIGGNAVANPDIIIVESPPLFNVIAARILSWVKRCPFIFWVADLWPESAVQLGALRNSTFIKLSEWLEWSTYLRAKRVWVVTEGMQNTLIHRGLPSERLMLIMNGVDCTRFCPQPMAQARATLGWDDRFTVLYAGTHGLSHGLTTIINAAEKLQQYKNIHFIMIGDGAEKANLIAQVRQRHIENVTFLEPVPHEMMPTVLNATDICLAHTRKLPLFEGMLPMKMYEAMACARPLLLALNGEAYRMAVEEAKAAVHVEPEDADALASTVLHLSEHLEVVAQMGYNGQKFIQGRFDYDTLTGQLNEYLNSIPGIKNDRISVQGSVE